MNSIHLAEHSYGSEGSLRLGVTRRQFWLQNHLKEHLYISNQSESPLPFEVLEQIPNNSSNGINSLRQIERSSRLMKSSKRAIVGPDYIEGDSLQNSQQMHLQEDGEHQEIALQSYLDRYSRNSRNNISGSNALLASNEMTPVMGADGAVQKFKKRRKPLIINRTPKMESVKSLNATPNTQTQQQQGKKIDLYKFLYFYNHFLVLLKALLVFVFPQYLTAQQLQLIGDASYEGVDQEGVVSGQYLNVKEILYKLKFEYGLFRKKSIYKKIQNFLIFFDEILHIFAIAARFSKNSLNYVGTKVPCISPFSAICIIWELFIVFIILHLAFIIPYQIGFQIENSYTPIYQYYEFLALILDSLLKLNKKTYIEGQFSQSRYKIFKHYCKNEALFDILSLWSLTQGKESWFQLLFLFKINQLTATTEKIKQHLTISEKINSLLDLTTLLYRMVMFTHIVACIWNWIGIMEITEGDQSWATVYDLAQKKPLDRYIFALYFSVVSTFTIGYGDITPQTTLERGFIIVELLISSIFMGYNINAVGQILHNLNKQENDFTEHLRRVNSFMRAHNIDTELQDKARKAIGNLYSHEQNSKNANPVEQLAGVSKFLKDEILCNAYMQAVRASPFLKQCSRLFQEKIALQFQEQIYSYDEIILKEHEEKDYCPNLYFVAKGRVDIYLQVGNKQKLLSSISAGGYFGHQEFFCGANASDVSAKSIDMTYVYYLSLERFLSVASAFPNDKELFLQCRDSMLYKRDFGVIGVKCTGCNSSQHTLRQCPVLLYKNRVLQALYNQKKQRKVFEKSFVRKKQKRENSHKTLKYANEVFDYVQAFIEENSSLINVLFDVNDMDSQIAFSHENSSFSNQQQASIDAERQVSRLEPLSANFNNANSQENIMQLNSPTWYAINQKLDPKKVQQQKQKRNSKTSLRLIGEQPGNAELQAIQNDQQGLRNSLGNDLSIPSTQITSTVAQNQSSPAQQLAGRRQSQHHFSIIASKRIINSYKRNALDLDRQSNLSSLLAPEQNSQSLLAVPYPADNDRQQSYLDTPSKIQAKATQSSQNWQIVRQRKKSIFLNTATTEFIDQSAENDQMRTFSNYMPQNNYEQVLKLYEYGRFLKQINFQSKYQQQKQPLRKISSNKKRDMQQQFLQQIKPFKQLHLNYHIVEQLPLQRIEELIVDQQNFFMKQKSSKNQLPDQSLVQISINDDL